MNKPSELYGGNEYGKSGHLSVFTSLEQLMMLLKCRFQGFIFIYILPKTLITHRDMQLRSFKVETLKDKYTHNTCQFYVKPHSKNTQITLESQIFDEKALR